MAARRPVIQLFVIFASVVEPNQKFTPCSGLGCYAGEFGKSHGIVEKIQELGDLFSAEPRLDLEKVMQAAALPSVLLYGKENFDSLTNQLNRTFRSLEGYDESNAHGGNPEVDARKEWDASSARAIAEPLDTPENKYQYALYYHPLERTRRRTKWPRMLLAEYMAPLPRFPPLERNDQLVDALYTISSLIRLAYVYIASKRSAFELALQGAGKLLEKPLQLPPLEFLPLINYHNGDYLIYAALVEDAFRVAWSLVRSYEQPFNGSGYRKLSGRSFSQSMNLKIGAFASSSDSILFRILFWALHRIERSRLFVTTQSIVRKFAIIVKIISILIKLSNSFGRRIQRRHVKLLASILAGSPLAVMWENENRRGVISTQDMVKLINMRKKILLFASNTDQPKQKAIYSQAISQIDSFLNNSTVINPSLVRVYNRRRSHRAPMYGMAYYPSTFHNATGAEIEASFEKSSGGIEKLGVFGGLEGPFEKLMDQFFGLCMEINRTEFNRSEKVEDFEPT